MKKTITLFLSFLLILIFSCNAFASTTYKDYVAFRSYYGFNHQMENNSCTLELGKYDLRYYGFKVVSAKSFDEGGEYSLSFSIKKKEGTEYRTIFTRDNKGRDFPLSLKKLELKEPGEYLVEINDSRPGYLVLRYNIETQ